MSARKQPDSFNYQQKLFGGSWMRDRKPSGRLEADLGFPKIDYETQQALNSFLKNQGIRPQWLGKPHNGFTFLRMTLTGEIPSEISKVLSRHPQIPRYISDRFQSFSWDKELEPADTYSLWLWSDHVAARKTLVTILHRMDVSIVGHYPEPNKDLVITVSAADYETKIQPCIINFTAQNGSLLDRLSGQQIFQLG